MTLPLRKLFVGVHSLIEVAAITDCVIRDALGTANGHFEMEMRRPGSIINT